MQRTPSFLASAESLLAERELEEECAVEQDKVEDERGSNPVGRDC